MTQSILFAPEDTEHSSAPNNGVLDSSGTLNTCELGDISEMKFEIEACTRGWLVASPRGRTRDFDCIIKRQTTRPITVQVKRSRKQSEFRYLFNTSRGLGKTGRRVSYSHTAFDVLAVHLWDVDKWLFYSRQEIGNRHGLSYTLPNGRVTNLRVGATTADRNPENWDLLDDVAESLTFSEGRTADV